MCVVSMITGYYYEKWKDIPTPPPVQPTYVPYPVPAVPQEEVDEFRKLLELAREYDRKNHQPDCETEQKKEAVRELARKLGLGELEFLDEDK